MTTTHAHHHTAPPVELSRAAADRLFRRQSPVAATLHAAPTARGTRAAPVAVAAMFTRLGVGRCFQTGPDTVEIHDGPAVYRLRLEAAPRANAAPTKKPARAKAATYRIEWTEQDRFGRFHHHWHPIRIKEIEAALALHPGAMVFRVTADREEVYRHGRSGGTPELPPDPPGLGPSVDDLAAAGERERTLPGTRYEVEYHGRGRFPWRVVAVDGDQRRPVLEYESDRAAHLGVLGFHAMQGERWGRRNPPARKGTRAR